MKRFSLYGYGHVSFISIMIKHVLINGNKRIIYVYQRLNDQHNFLREMFSFKWRGSRGD